MLLCGLLTQFYILQEGFFSIEGRRRLVYPACWILHLEVTLKTNIFMNFMRHIKCVF